VWALGTAHTQEAMRQDGALKKRLELVLHERRHTRSRLRFEYDLVTGRGGHFPNQKQAVARG